VAAAASSLPEVCGDGARLVEPTAEGLAGGLRAVLDDGEDIARLRVAALARAGLFSWERTAAAHAAVYQEVLSGAG
jgi:glycosyltransferase involved in cell wall biosynthesis